MTTRDARLQRYDEYRGVEVLGDTFKLSKDGRTLRCVLSTHTLGWELRLSIGDELIRSQVCKTQDDVFDVGEAWQEEATGKGWS